MTTMNVEPYEASLDAGTEDVKARAAAKMVSSPNHLASRDNLAEVSSEMKAALVRVDARLTGVEARLDEMMEARLERMDADRIRGESSMLKAMVIMGSITCGVIVGAISIATAIILSHLSSL